MSMSVDQIALTWSLVSIQGIRRLLESLFLVKPSSSSMWFVHWLLGIAFYLAMGIAVWIEGAGQYTHAPNFTNKRPRGKQITWPETSPSFVH